MNKGWKMVRWLRKATILSGGALFVCTSIAGAQSLAADAATKPSTASEAPHVAAVPAKVFSFGNAPHSLMYTPAQVNAMKAYLEKFESSGAQATVVENVGVEDVALPGESEPSPYPVFYVASIVYRNAADWVVFIRESSVVVSTPQGGAAAPVAAPMAAAGGDIMRRVTPTTNTGELLLKNVTADHVDFVWKPSYLSAVQHRYDDKKFSSIDPVKHRLAMHNHVVFDKDARAVTFSLKQGQSFASEYFHCFEGRIPSGSAASANAVGVAASPLVPIDADSKAVSLPASNDAMAPANLDQMLKEDAQDRGEYPTTNEGNPSSPSTLFH